jgi:hypothetical protein
MAGTGATSATSVGGGCLTVMVIGMVRLALVRLSVCAPSAAVSLIAIFPVRLVSVVVMSLIVISASVDSSLAFFRLVPVSEIVSGAPSFKLNLCGSYSPQLAAIYWLSEPVYP